MDIVILLIWLVSIFGALILGYYGGREIRIIEIKSDETITSLNGVLDEYKEGKEVLYEDEPAFVPTDSQTVKERKAALYKTPEDVGFY